MYSQRSESLLFTHVPQWLLLGFTPMVHIQNSRHHAFTRSVSAHALTCCWCTLQAVLLGHNALTAVPTLTTFRGTAFISLRYNSITALPPGTFGDADQSIDDLSIDLEGNNISSLDAGAFSQFAGTSLRVRFGRNGLRTLAREVFRDCDAEWLFVTLSNNRIGPTLPSETFAGFTGGNLVVDLKSNRLETVLNETFPGFSAFVLGVDLSSNLISSIEPGGAFQFGGSQLRVDMSNSSFGGGTLASATFGLFTAPFLRIDLSSSNIGVTEGIFHGFRGTVGCTVILSDNSLDGQSLKSAVNSFVTSVAALTLNLSWNRITTVPGQLFTGFTSGTGLTVGKGFRHPPLC